MKVALIDIIPAFELATKHKVAAIYAAPGVIKDRILAGEPTDILVFPAPGLDDLVKQGKIAADSKIILARSGDESDRDATTSRNPLRSIWPTIAAPCVLLVQLRQVRSSPAGKARPSGIEPVRTS